MINREGCEGKLYSHCTVYRKRDDFCGCCGCLAWGVGALVTASGGGDWIGIGRSGGLFCKLDTHTKHQAFWVAWSERVHWAYVFRMGSSNRSFTMKLLACTSVLFVTVSFPGLRTVGIFPGFAWRDWGKAWITSFKLIIVGAEIRHRRVSIMSKALPLVSNCSMGTFGSDIAYRVFWWAGIAQSVWRLATGWTVRGSNPGGGESFRTGPHRPWDPPSLLYNGYRVF
jgi:hypothetical protein